jgi:hypothetical protein
MEIEVVVGEGRSDSFRKVSIPSILSSFWGDVYVCIGSRHRNY